MEVFIGRLKAIFWCSFIVLFTAISCSEENQPARGSASFSFKNTSAPGSRIQETASKLLVSIKDGQGTLIHNKLEISLYNFEGEFISEPLVLDAGNYSLEEFIVLNSSNEVIYVCPIEGSTLAYLVEKPLAIDFIVEKDEVTNVVPEVITAEGNAAIDFGYTTFSFQIVNTLKFLSSAFIYNTTTDALELSAHTLLVKSGDDTLYYSAKPNESTFTVVRSDYTDYTLIFSKTGYTTEIAQFTKDELLANYQTTPIVVVFTDVILTNGLVAHYSFKGGIAGDLTGNGNNGTISGSTSVTDRLGRSNESMKFNSSDDYIKVNSPSFLTNNEGTFAAWVKFDDLGHTQYVGSVGDEQSIESYLSFLRIDGTEKKVGLYQREAGAANWLKGTTVLQTNTYYHLVMLSTGTEWKIYINGQPETLSIVGGGNNGKWISDLAGIDNFVIGSSIIQAPYTIPYLSGNIDEVRLYNRALSQSEITALFNTTK